MLALDKGSSSTWDHEFLNWFSGLGIPLFEKELFLGGLRYHHFSTLFSVADGRKCSSFGSHPNRRVAALKCAAEALERQAMVQFFIQKEPRIPKALCNSNGWAVHSSANLAKERALSEVIERHLLLKSYFTFGWAGFQLFHSLQSGDIRLTLLVSKFTTHGQVAGLVIAKSPHYPGVSFGYCAGNSKKYGEASFWQSAIFEAVDRILILKGERFIDTTDSWIRQAITTYLETPFEEVPFGLENPTFTECEIGEFECHVIDLGLEKGLSFPLYAVFIHGGSLIPLFSKPALDLESAKHLESILQKNNLTLTQMPERHPVL